MQYKEVVSILSWWFKRDYFQSKNVDNQKDLVYEVCSYKKPTRSFKEPLYIMTMENSILLLTFSINGQTLFFSEACFLSPFFNARERCLSGFNQLNEDERSRISVKRWGCFSFVHIWFGCPCYLYSFLLSSCISCFKSGITNVLGLVAQWERERQIPLCMHAHIPKCSCICVHINGAASTGVRSC